MQFFATILEWVIRLPETLAGGVRSNDVNTVNVKTQRQISQFLVPSKIIYNIVNFSLNFYPNFVVDIAM